MSSPRRRLVGRAAPGDHVGRHRPGRAGEADQRHLRRQRRAHGAHRLVDRRQRLVHRLGGPQPREIRGRRHRREPRALALDEDELRAQRVRHQQDVGEEDGRVEAVAADRLQRHLGGELRRVAEVEEARRPGPRPRGTPAGSARPGASSRPAAPAAPRRASARIIGLVSPAIPPVPRLAAVAGATLQIGPGKESRARCPSTFPTPTGRSGSAPAAARWRWRRRARRATG